MSYADILNYSGEATDSSQRDFFAIEPVKIEVNSGIFSHPGFDMVFSRVGVFQTEDKITISCTCGNVGSRICRHQAQVLHNILERPDFKIFFDNQLRERRLKEEARLFGMEKESFPERYFTLNYSNQKVQIEPREKGLIRVDKTNLETVKGKWLTSPIEQLPGRNLSSIGKKTILVLHTHKYYGNISFELLEGEVTREGKMKNPLSPLDSIELSLKAQNLEESRFFSAVSRFQKISTTQDQASELQTLRWIVRKPENIEVFFQQKGISESITATSISPIELRQPGMEIKLSVFKKEPFYEVTCELIVHDKSYPIKALPFVFDWHGQ